MKKPKIQAVNKVGLLVFVFLLLVMGAATAHQPVPPSGTNGLASDNAKLPVVIVTNLDGSVIKASADVKTMVQLSVEEVAAITNAAAATTTNKFSLETKALAEKGDATEQVLLGYRYFTGLGAAKDYTEAAKWFRKAADQGNADGENNLGACYANGFGVPQDKTEADKWYHSAVAQGLKESKLKTLAEQGDADAQLDFGMTCLFIATTPKDYDEAIEWIRKAAEQGNADAQHELGVIYEIAQGVPQDFTEAAKWFRKAAEQGNADAESNLGFLYSLGRGVPQDYVEAYKWWNLAAAQGETNAISNRASIAGSMTPDQIAEAQQLAREFKPRKESGSANSISSDSPTASGSGFFITDDGYLITNNHVVKDATKVRLLTSAGLIDAKVVQVDAANDLALLKADGRFAPLPIAASRTVNLGGTVATVGFPDIGLQGFAPRKVTGDG